MKKMKKVFAVMLSLAMVLGMAMTVSAAGTKPVPADSKKVTIENVENGATYAVYQIIDATYNENGFTGYVWAEGTSMAGQKVTFEDGAVVGLTSEEITKLAANPGALKEKNENFKPDKDELTAGTWMVLVTPPETNAVKTYNPMVVSVFYTVEGSGSNNTLVTDVLDASENWTLETTDAFAKSSEIKLDKKLDDVEFDTEVKLGQDVSFTITSEIPSYDPTYYENPVFNVTDTIVNGLKYKTEPVVTVGTDGVGDGVKTLTKGTEYTSNYDANNATFTITFTPSYITGLADKSKDERAVNIKYSATITDDAVVMVGENKATLDYTRTPDETSTKDDKEQVFTFALNGVFGKIGDDGKALPDATFTLYEEVKEAGTDTTEIKWSETETVNGIVFGEVVTGADGKIDFKGLDGDKTYYLMETAAPDGYSINDTIYKIDIAFVDPGDAYEGEDVTYTITVTKNKPNEGDGEDDLTKTYTVTLNGTNKKGDTEINVGEFGNEASGEKINIPNTKLGNLPSTGGIGTTIFTIGGCAIMIIAAGLFFASRRKSSKDSAKEA